MSDRELTDLLATAAAAAPTPAAAGPPLPSADDQDDDAPADAAGVPSRRRWTRPLAAAAAVALALAVGSRVLDDPSPTDGDSGGPADIAGGETSGGMDGDGGMGVGAGSSDGGNAGVGRGGSGGTSTDALSEGGSDFDAIPTPVLPLGSAAGVGSTGSAGVAQGAQPRVVHTGHLELEVEDGAFAATVERVTSLATGLGGFVVETSTSEQDDDPSGSLTVRVPAASFDPLVAEVRRLGEVQAVTTSGEDVTAQYVDLEARLGALRATRDQFLVVLEEASAIGDILAVQDRINIVNVEIESLEGQRRLLEDRSNLGTLTVSIGEPGARAPVEAAAPSGDGGVGGAWDEARRGFGDAIEWFVARSGKGLVLAVIALALLALGQLALRRLRRTAL